ncbi:MAG: TIGR00288 family NYN domain-containing protein [Candidatus Aenigmatarchaeota archaeon]|nr:TIGR00288 family NYN domain-containing protein [Candidatus Aenigmarchaeota archaeon]
MVFEKLFRISEKKRIAVFIDGPNMIRKEFNIDLKEFKRRIEKYGRIVIGKVFLNQFASEKLIEAVSNEGFETIIALGDPEQKTDVDVAITVHAMEAIYNKNIDIIALASRDADFLALIQKAKEMGKQVILIAAERGLASSLKNSADFVELL